MAFHKALKDLNLPYSFPVCRSNGGSGDYADSVGDYIRYIEHTTEEVSNACQSDKIRELQRRIAAIKSSEVIGVKYMQEWEEKR